MGCSDVFHVVTYLELRGGGDLIKRLRVFKQVTEGQGAAWINAGRVATNGVGSTQLGDSDWSAVVLLQYPSRAIYDEAASTPEYKKALARFDRQYSHGMRRGVTNNLMLPQRMFQRRVSAALWGPESPRPFAPADTVRMHHQQPGAVRLGCSPAQLLPAASNRAPQQSAAASAAYDIGGIVAAAIHHENLQRPGPCGQIRQEQWKGAGFVEGRNHHAQPSHGRRSAH